jgi:hypothetical protein
MVNDVVLEADHEILSTGAGTAKIFADSNSEKPELQVDDSIGAAAVITEIVKLNLQYGKPYAGISVPIHGMASVQGTVRYICE